jgi:hypothetical protein
MDARNSVSIHAGLHDLRRPWRYWLWGEEALEVPRGKIHEDVAEQVVVAADVPPGMTAQRWLLEHGAVKQWDLHFISGSKTREVLRTIQEQLWCMVEEESLDTSRVMMVVLGDHYAILPVDEVLYARSMNDVLTQCGEMRENATSDADVFEASPWHAWYYRGEWVQLPGFDDIHEDLALDLLKRDEPGYVHYTGGAGSRLMRVYGAIKQWGFGFGVWALTRDNLRVIQERVADMVSKGCRAGAKVQVFWGPNQGDDDTGVAVLTISELLEANNERDVLAVSGMRRNPSYLDTVKKVMAESYGEATTLNPNESGFLLADGTWLKMGMDGRQGDDHRVVTGYVRGKLLKEVYEGDRWNALVHWMQVTKSIRWMPEICSFDIFVKPSREQLDQIWRMARRCEEITVEQTRGKKNEQRVFEPAERDLMVEWIRAFWR